MVPNIHITTAIRTSDPRACMFKTLRHTRSGDSRLRPIKRVTTENIKRHCAVQVASPSFSFYSTFPCPSSNSSSFLLFLPLFLLFLPLFLLLPSSHSIHYTLYSCTTFTRLHLLSYHSQWIINATPLSKLPHRHSETSVTERL